MLKELIITTTDNTNTQDAELKIWEPNSMDSTQIYRILTQKIRRGILIFYVLKIISMVACVYLLITDGVGPWVALYFVAVVISYVSIGHVRKRAIAATKVSQDPQIVYWAHPSTPHEPLSSNSIHECTILTLHLRDGTQLEVNLPLKQMNDFIAWLKEHNSTIRWGPYDGTLL
jgi:hypothetical protein